MRGNDLKIDEKNKLCEYKAANPKLLAKHLIEFCSKEFNKTPSTTAISRILHDEEKWKNAGTAASAKRIRGGNWPDLEKILVVWLTQVEYDNAVTPLMSSKFNQATHFGLTSSLPLRFHQLQGFNFPLCACLNILDRTVIVHFVFSYNEGFTRP
jgi:hypothetical protein